MASCPPCFFSVAQYKAWRQKAIESGEDPENYCRDCNPRYQARMVKDSRCRHPEVTFEKRQNDDLELEMVGVHPSAAA